ncbi:MAG: dTMP kinase [Candidatus Taylorbacteria bacterium RIFCSPHIGHO2_02_FULL_44_36]|uniref:Thymidylate kinase n=1 Tax=Candidatus Taylorbacteria bacterium RIFCSPLOWO2_12_FULL_44_15c TaxID=1802333 RepID=A0A1G2P6E9_9BACT|nr:MAG: dTMP kinase [Candidatus Taylorbacteria bacterium RIFCSPHIGHO2_02_FULL_44_36]OHA38136.1 MAG: dTMP kinase [Candidatus Taylorbacteria bacterium RIFCSPLOWO2_02_FULL_44_35]OHA43131.1 MAG: dTMP kinase [Candidatus Taylorbacteria bacterium RIFCSPLOWO2_12_FULL_44_15c]
MKRGKFIVVDGGEGSGKTAILKWFAETSFGKKFLLTYEPGGTEFADKIRTLVLSKEAKESGAETQFGLMWAARADHLQHKILPALARGKNVICDRFDSSTYAYQICAQGARNLKDLFWQTREIYLREAAPDFYIFFDVKPEIGLARVALRRVKKTHFDERKLAFHKRVHSGFLEFSKNVPHKIIDANQNIDKVRNDFLKIISDLTRN